MKYQVMKKSEKNDLKKKGAVAKRKE